MNTATINTSLEYKVSSLLGKLELKFSQVSQINEDIDKRLSAAFDQITVKIEKTNTDLNLLDQSILHLTSTIKELDNILSSAGRISLMSREYRYDKENKNNNGGTKQTDRISSNLVTDGPKEPTYLDALSVASSVGTIVAPIANFEGPVGIITALAVTALSAAIPTIKYKYEVHEKKLENEERLTSFLSNRKNGAIANERIKRLGEASGYSEEELINTFYGKLKSHGVNTSMDNMKSFVNLAKHLNTLPDKLADALIDAEGGHYERLQELGIKVVKRGKILNTIFEGVENQIQNTPKSIDDQIFKLGRQPGIANTIKVLGDPEKSSFDLRKGFYSEISGLEKELRNTNLSDMQRNEILSKLTLRFPEITYGINLNRNNNARLLWRLQDTKDEYKNEAKQYGANKALANLQLEYKNKEKEITVFKKMTTLMPSMKNNPEAVEKGLAKLEVEKQNINKKIEKKKSDISNINNEDIFLKSKRLFTGLDFGSEKYKAKFGNNHKLASEFYDLYESLRTKHWTPYNMSRMEYILNYQNKKNDIHKKEIHSKPHANPVRNTFSGIHGGNNTIIINLGKLQDKTIINCSSLDEGIKNAETPLINMLLRVLNSANGVKSN